MFVIGELIPFVALIAVGSFHQHHKIIRKAPFSGAFIGIVGYDYTVYIY
jgi:hypothetical protein